MDFALNTDGDLDIQNGVLVRIEGADEVAQRIRQRLRTFYGEWFLNLTAGVPYFEAILVKNPDRTTVDALFKKAILETPGLLELTKFELQLDTSDRTLTVSIAGRATDGPIELLEVFP